MRKYITPFIILVSLSLLFPVVVFGVAGSAVVSVFIYDPSGVTLDILAVPEKRVPNVSESQVLNRSTQLALKIYDVGADRTNTSTILFSTTTLTDDSGASSFLVPDFVPGNYDATFKGYSHLTKLVTNTEFGYVATVDATSSSTDPLLSGDINLTNGDDKINALDISILVDSWGTDNERADLNADTEVNSIDISNLLNNFNAVGD